MPNLEIMSDGPIFIHLTFHLEHLKSNLCWHFYLGILNVLVRLITSTFRKLGG